MKRYDLREFGTPPEKVVYVTPEQLAAKLQAIVQLKIICYNTAMDKELLYKSVEKALSRGNNVEIRKKPNGEWQIMEVKKNIIAQLIGIMLELQELSQKCGGSFFYREFV